MSGGETTEGTESEKNETEGRRKANEEDGGPFDSEKNETKGKGKANEEDRGPFTLYVPKEYCEERINISSDSEQEDIVEVDNSRFDTSSDEKVELMKEKYRGPHNKH